MSWAMMAPGTLSEPENWQVETLQAANDALLEHVYELQEFIKTQKERWVSDVSILEGQILEMEANLALKEKELVFQGRKFDLVTGTMQAENMLCRLTSEFLEEEVTETKALLDCLCGPCSPQRNSKSGGSEVRTNSQIEDSITFRSERSWLKEDRALISAQEASLVRENKFVREQYNLTVSNLTNRLTSKQEELDQSKEKISNLLCTMEALQSLITEKDEEISRLKTNLGERESETNRWKDEASKLSTELKISRNHAPSVLPNNSTEQRRSSQRFKCKMKDGLATPQTHARSKPSEQHRRGGGSKRKGTDHVLFIGTPKLFSSSFKVPKLKV